MTIQKFQPINNHLKKVVKRQKSCFEIYQKVCGWFWDLLLWNLLMWPEANNCFVPITQDEIEMEAFSKLFIMHYNLPRCILANKLTIDANSIQTTYNNKSEQVDAKILQDELDHYTKNSLFFQYSFTNLTIT